MQRDLKCEAEIRERDSCKENIEKAKFIIKNIYIKKTLKKQIVCPISERMVVNKIEKKFAKRNSSSSFFFFFFFLNYFLSHIPLSCQDLSQQQSSMPSYTI